MTPNALYDGPAWARAKHFRRFQTVVTVLTTNTLLVGVNPNRIGLIVSSPAALPANQGANTFAANAVDTSTAGVKLATAGSATRQQILTSASMVETTGTTVVADLELLRSAVATKLARITNAGQVTLNMPLSVNDVVQWDVTTPIAASVTDFAIGLSQSQSLPRITLSINSPAVDGQGICLYAGQYPLVLWRDVIGDALTEDVFAISLTASQVIGVWDIFY